MRGCRQRWGEQGEAKTACVWVNVLPLYNRQFVMDISDLPEKRRRLTGKRVMF